MHAFNEYVTTHADRFVAELQAFCRQPSIAAQNRGMTEMAQMVANRLAGLGAAPRLMAVDGGFPVVYGEQRGGPRRLVIYNHYDVQPPEPLELWTTPPFEPTIRDGKLFARGVADNKGNLLARIHAVEAWQATMGELPVSLQWVVEGEEEIGSVHLAAWVAQHRELLAGADGCLWEFGYKDAARRPVLSLGVKGIYYVELRVQGAARDLHSSMAAIVPNPAWRLIWALSTIKDPEDRILVDGLMAHVREPSPAALRLLEAMPSDEGEMLESYQIPAFINGLRGAALNKKLFYQPTCTVCGFLTGYTGEGSKTVLPHTAMVKVDFRLVPDLTPEIVHDLLRQHLDRRGFTDVEILPLGHEHPSQTDPDAPLVQAAADALRSVSGQEPVIRPTAAGSGPMYPLCEGLGIPAVAFGVGHAESNTYAPDENIFLEDYLEGIRCVGELFRRFAAS